jgi:probable rRNA maturation factor
MAVRFFSEEILFKTPHPRIYAKWIKTAASSEGFAIGELNYILTSDEYLLQMNRQYLHHDTLTDIITFGETDNAAVINGDIFISIPRVLENAAKFSQPFEREFGRVLIHGLLHLVGYQDKSLKAKKEMRKKEDAYLSLLSF